MHVIISCVTTLRAVATNQAVNNWTFFPYEFTMFLLFTTIFIAASLVTIDLLTEVRA